ncbi:hypothetical protein WN48_04557 [Eufriesea mexicana]|nr:hypothetical protein WN48_04557 [Eufriesea mexicana]
MTVLREPVCNEYYRKIADEVRSCLIRSCFSRSESRSIFCQEDSRTANCNLMNEEGRNDPSSLRLTLDYTYTPCLDP